QAGALYCFGLPRSAIFERIGDLVKFSENHHEAKSTGQVLLFAESNSDDEPDEADEFVIDPKAVGAPQRANYWLNQEKKLLGVFMHGHPLDLFANDLSKFSQHRIADLPSLAGKSGIVVVGLLVDHFERTTRE